MSQQPNFIRCRFCSWKTAKWKGNADPGKVKGPSNAFARLRAHINDEHWEAREAIIGNHEDFAEDSGMPLEVKE